MKKLTPIAAPDNGTFTRRSINPLEAVGTILPSFRCNIKSIIEGI